ncbi:uncharacterized protein FIBRA_04781 [Fibroporia radiculosa]|uniref:Uncharacterized protein n=1 Tax=Fibroporia radiculosa TaxID=599839 RepID=J4IAC6_9APHY|nr:uncharacterized protein FIBRA_04781 [Fibroporia radiculosa]CCM02676.1 predicted protein [Fibroporia radiculosa]
MWTWLLHHFHNPIQLSFEEKILSNLQTAIRQRGFASNQPHDESQRELYPESVLRHAEHASERIKILSPKSSAENLRSAGHAIQQVVDGLHREPCALETLLVSVAEFFQRVAPVFASAIIQREEIVTVRRGLNQLREINQHLREDGEKTERLMQRALEAADQARKEVVSLRERNDQLKQHIETSKKEFLTQVSEKSKEADGLRSMMIAHKDKAVRQKAKIAELRQQVAVNITTINDLTRLAVKPSVSSQSPHWTGHSRRASGQEDLKASIFEPDDTYEFGNSEANTHSTSDYLESGPSTQQPALLPSPSSRSSPKIVTPQKMFQSDWNFRQYDNKKRKRMSSEDRSKVGPIALDSNGRVKGTVQLGPRQKHRL